MKRRRKLIIVLAAIAVILTAVYIGFIVVPRIQNARAVDRLLRSVGLEGHAELRLAHIDRWTDPLKYKDGYEILILSNGNNEEAVNGRIRSKPSNEITPWSPPDSWTIESISIAELSERLHVTVDLQPFSEASMGGDRCDAWFFIDRRGEDVPFEQREFFLCYYDEREDKVYIYHGHDLYGIGY